MSRWWRAYDEAVDDPKLGALNDRQHRAWFNLCCITSQNGGKLPPVAAIAFKLRMTVEKAKAIVAELVALKLFDVADDGVIAPHNWSGRQFQSDVSTERVKQFRQRQRNVSSTVSETPPDTEQKQITEQISSLRSDSAPKRTRARTRAKPRVPLPDLWQIDQQDWDYATERGFPPDQIRQMGAAFGNHHRGKGSLMADWHAAWRTWCENEIKFSSNRGNGNERRKTVHDAAREFHENLLERIAEFDEPAPRSLCGPEGSDAVRLLPSGRRQ